MVILGRMDAIGMKRGARGRLLRWGSAVLVAGLSCFAAACGDGGEATTGTGGSGGAPVGPACPAEREVAIGPIDKVSEGEVNVLSDMGGVKTLYVDASAGGVMEQDKNPWLYVSFATASRVDVTDKQADSSLDWDLAFKRPEIRTNSGLGAPGGGGAAFLKEAAFDAVTKDSAPAAVILVEDWFNESCALQVDEGGYIRTAFDGWYDYGGQDTHAVSPHPGVFVVRGAKGALYKLELESFYSNPDGTDGMAGGRFLLRYAPL